RRGDRGRRFRLRPQRAWQRKRPGLQARAERTRRPGAARGQPGGPAHIDPTPGGGGPAAPVVGGEGQAGRNFGRAVVVALIGRPGRGAGGGMARSGPPRGYDYAPQYYATPGYDPYAYRGYAPYYSP